MDHNFIAITKYPKLAYYNETYQYIQNPYPNPEYKYKFFINENKGILYLQGLINHICVR